MSFSVKDNESNKNAFLDGYSAVFWWKCFRNSTLFQCAVTDGGFEEDI